MRQSVNFGYKTRNGVLRARRSSLAQTESLQDVVASEEGAVLLAEDICFSSSQHRIHVYKNWEDSRKRKEGRKKKAHSHMKIVKQQMPTCTLATTINVLLVPNLINQFSPAEANPKLNRFLNINKHVNASTAISRCASTIYNALATAPNTIPMTCNAKKKSGQNQL